MAVLDFFAGLVDQMREGKALPLGLLASSNSPGKEIQANTTF